jgi:hypothetical protein
MQGRASGAGVGARGDGGGHGRESFSMDVRRWSMLVASWESGCD